MTEAEFDNLVGRSNILSLTPKEVRSLVAANLAVSSRCALIFLYLESISRYIVGICEWVVTVDVHIGTVILKIKVVCAIPFEVSLIECVLHIIATIALIKQLARGRAVVIYYIDTNLVTIAESRIINTGLINL